MDFDQTLTNPAARDLTPETDPPDTTEQQEQPTRSVIAREQLTLDVDQPGQLGRWVDNVRSKASRREMELELMPFWKNLASPFALVSSVALVVIVLLAGIVQFERIPPKVPFYYNAVDSRWEQADKIIILLLPVVLGVVDAILLRIIYAIFSFDKRLSIILSWILTLLNLLIIMAVSQLYLLIL